MAEYKLKNAGLTLKFKFPSTEAISLTLDNVDGPPMPINSQYMLVPGRSADGQIGGWQARILDNGIDLSILDYLNKNGPVWKNPFYTRDYPFCWTRLESGDMRYRVFTQRETDFVKLNPDNVPVYSQVGIYKANRIHSDYAQQLTTLSHWQDLKQCCYFDPTGVNKQPPAGLKGVVLVHAEPTEEEEIMLLYYTRIIDIRMHNYDKQFPHGYPTYMTPLIEPPASGPGDWHRPNLCVAEYNTKTNAITKYYNGHFVPGQKYDSGLLDRPAMYGRMLRYKDHLIYTAQSQGNVGVHVFSSKNRLDWAFECTIPLADVYHPTLIEIEEGRYVFYYCKDRDLKYTFGLRTENVEITEIA